jgi:hypothetical protein
VPLARRGTRQRRAVEDFFVGPAHGFSFKLQVESFKFSILAGDFPGNAILLRLHIYSF